MPRVQFYSFNRFTRVRELMSFKVTNKADAIKALQRMNIPAGWYKPIDDIRYSEKISNPKYQN